MKTRKDYSFNNNQHFYFLPKHFIKSKKGRFISSILAGITFLTGMCSVLTISHFGVYFLSDIHYKYSWVQIQYGNLLNPSFGFFLAVFSPFSGIFEKLIGPNITILLGITIVEFTLFGLYLIRNIYMLYFSMFLFGLSFGFCSSITMKNACCYYSNKRGIISSSLMSTATLISAGVSVLGEKFINPNSMPIIDKVKQPYYTKDIASRSWNYLKLPIIYLPISLLLTEFLFIKYESNGQSVEEQVNYEKVTSQSEMTNNTNDINQKEGDTIQTKENYIKNIKYALCHKRFWKNVGIGSLTPFCLLFISQSSRAYSSLAGVNPSFITFQPALMMIIFCVISPIWGCLTDKFGFRKIIRIVSVLALIFDIYFTLFLSVNILYVIGLILSGITASGMIVSMSPHLMQIYGMEHYLIIGGIMRLFNGIINILSSGLSIVISIYYKTAKEMQTPYRIICFISIFLTFFAVLLAFSETDDKFVYPFEEKFHQRNNIELEEHKNEKDLDSLND